MRLVPGSAVHLPCDCESYKIFLLQFPILTAGIGVFLEAW